MELLHGLGDVTLLERPAPMVSVVSAVQAAVRGRQRQYQIRDQIEAIRKGDAALRESEQRLRVAVNTARLGLWHLDLHTQVITCSDVCKAHFGRTPLDHFTHEELANSVHPQDFDRVGVAVGRAIAEQIDFDTEYRIVWPDGSIHWIVARGHIAQGPDHEPLSMSGVTLDITERKRVEQEREALLESERAARGDAERANHIKDEFLATLSHELRTPLNAILGWAQLLTRATPDAEELKQGLETIERNARAQTQLIEDLLDMSRIISGKIRLDVRSIDPMACIEAAIETVRPAADAKSIRIMKVLDPQAGPVTGDANRLQQVFWNLLSNAIKFTPKGGKVEILLKRVNSHIEITVADTGQGIHPDFLPAVFDRFRQADASTTRTHGGLGLGLAIVKQLVELHGGTIEAKSAGPGQGSTFVVSLPVTIVHSRLPVDAAARPAPIRAPQVDRDAESLKGICVLVVDDEPDARALVKRILEECGAAVQTAGSAAEALEMLSDLRPDLVISDIGMPELDGYEFIRRVRALATGARMPAIALTAFARSEDRTRALRAGFVAHVAKPVEPAELVAAVASISGRA
jgi:PAS domain S-box-containing protein